MRIQYVIMCVHNVHIRLFSMCVCGQAGLEVDFHYFVVHVYIYKSVRMTECVDRKNKNTETG